MPLLCGTPLRAAREAALLEAQARSPGPRADPGAHGHRQEAPPRGSPRGTPAAAPRLWQGSFGTRPRALRGGLAVLGAKRGAPHLLVPGTGPRGAGLAQSRAAQGQQGQRPAPGRAGPGPHCARGAGSGARRVAASARVCGRRGAAGANRRLGPFAAPPPRSAAAPSGFSLPLLLFQPVGPRFSSVPQ